ncbi:TetR/AcrR family transcriptional regulator [Thaumasiovibrio subtropicus]|uniref:TetR/AcrR family transcriptional regulator n=1 Tax=Thaumasiovibrio subtropicus TaxID=1891207 RepID=UPI000B35B751|nr:TetR family transcriptional regulator [Thaumasiovibrio subtropicus]
MKLQQKKAEIKKKIIDAAVELMADEGFKNVSMRKIAKQAGVGDATIYNYFPSKEKILYGYFEQIITQSIADVDETQGIDEFEVHEKVQLLLEIHLGYLLNHREFVAEAFELAFLSPAAKYGAISPLKQQLTETFASYLEAAYDAGQLQPQSGSSFIPSLFWDYYIGVVAYWLRDDSEEFTQTTQLIDLSLALAMSVLESGILNKAGDMMGFLFRNHMFSGFDYVTKALNTIRPLKRR